MEVKNAATVVGQHEKHVKNLEVNRWPCKEVARDQLLRVILQKRPPSLGRRLAAAHHVFADAALPDVDAELAQLTVDAGRSPTRILTAHPADQIANLTRNRGPSPPATSHLPCPEKPKASTVRERKIADKVANTVASDIGMAGEV
jgi:hypothetical protein